MRGAAVPPPSGTLFADRDALRANCIREGASDLTVLECSSSNILLFSQGNFQLIRNDLLAAGVSPAAIDAFEEGPGVALLQAFDVRRELVNYKKECELQQMMAYFFWQDEDPILDKMAHTTAVCEPFDPAVTAAAAARHSIDGAGHVSAGAGGGSASTVVQQLTSTPLLPHPQPPPAAEHHTRSPSSPPGPDHTRCTPAASLLDRKRLYLAASRALMRHRGTVRAMHDARDIAKAICLSPRHPDGSRPRKLRELPGSMYADQACTAAMASNPAQGRKSQHRRQHHPSHSPSPAAAPESTSTSTLTTTPTSSASASASSPQPPLLPPPGHVALRTVMEKVAADLKWPHAALEFLETCIIARGGFKALAIVDELCNYNRHLAHLPARLMSVLAQYKAATRAAAETRAAAAAAHDEDDGAGDDGIGKTVRTVAAGGASPSKVGFSDDELSAAVQRDKHTNVLEGALAACSENAKWVAILAARAESDPATLYASNCARGGPNRLFVAGDNVAVHHACAFVPKGFALGAIGAASRTALNAVLLPTMRASIAFEGWPPQCKTRRTRARAFTTATVAVAAAAEASAAAAKVAAGDGGGEDMAAAPPEKAIRGSFPLPNFLAKATQRCTACDGHFDTLWVRMGLCSVCEATIRLTGAGHDQCLFKCKLGQAVFCPHAGKCFVCDAPHSCEDECRLSRGDGEVATAMAEMLKPSLLLLDFDRTLATTKSGASPLPAPGKVLKGAGHSVDAELKAAVAARPAGSAHIITRNSHKAEIVAFLNLQGMADLAKNVHVVPKKKTKGAFIREKFYTLEECSGGGGGGNGSGCSNDVGSDDALRYNSKTCLFIDDDIRELVAEPWLREDARVHRLLFVRALF